SLQVAERLGGFDKFHTASLADVFAAYELDAGGFMDLPRIVEDGVVLPAIPLREVFASADNYSTVPTISGINRDEMKLFNLFDERLTETKMGQFIVARDQDIYDAASEYGSRNWRVRSVDAPLTMMRDGGHEDIYAYQFDWDEGGKFLWMDLSKMLGAAHGIEIPFVFNRFSILGDADKIMFKKKTFKTRDQLSRAMGAYWAAFARTGTPDVDGQPVWPRFGPEANVIHFDSENDAGIHLKKGAETADQLVSDFFEDPRVTEAYRCGIASFLNEWMLEPNMQLSSLNTEQKCV
ncbi:MAG: hypothetical protein EX271_12945, partial [Acidimicrobiales bacterium]